ncbi:MFS transporter [Nannocystis bainbridge]|uniref:MFS transporter n=1 Tax=Nannocystis bainbridge TaxID=2995303 RepID=A0ABT5E3C3_9BACT|nr:MFS transporter [Nannocystis bainbridge]MDC0720370.1 MFS transporter [Nannocystis bainbridge]
MLSRTIFVLALASFATGTEAYVYAGHLEALAEELDQPVAAAGQLATAFAFTYAITAPLIAGLVAHLGRRPVIVAGLALLGGLNLLAAVSPTFWGLIVIRILCGLTAGLVGPISSIAAAELAPPERRGQAMAIVFGGMTLAFVLGIPVGSAIGDLAGWRGTFVYAGVIAIAAALAIRLVLPAMPGGTRTDRHALSIVRERPVHAHLLLTLVGFASTFTVIAYVGPVVTAITGLTGSGIGVMQMLIGLGSIVGIVVGGRSADRPGAQRVLVLSFLVSAFSLASYSALMSGPGLVASAIASAPVLVMLAVGMVLGASALFTRTPIVQARLLAVTRPEARPVVLALNGSMVFFGQGLGASIGGAAIGLGGIEAIGGAGAAVALVGALLALAASRASACDA